MLTRGTNYNYLLIITTLGGIILLPTTFHALEFRQLKDSSDLRVMTFNIWQNGDNVVNGLAKVFREIAKEDPDIVFLQEAKNPNSLIPYIGNNWQFCFGTETVILSKYPITRRYPKSDIPLGIGCQIEVPSSTFPPKRPLRINLWNVHMHWTHYGPYAACMKNTVDDQQLYLCEDNGQRCGQANALLFNYDFYECLMDSAPTAPGLHIPLILAGDFNAPSFLDWTNSTRFKHCDWTYVWPVSATLNSYGFIDSFRQVHPDPLLDPGETWSPVYKYDSRFPGVYIPEPQDRIDYIYYKSNPTVLTAVDSHVTIGGTNPDIDPNYRNNQWPSDHAAVVTQFKLTFEHDY